VDEAIEMSSTYQPREMLSQISSYLPTSHPQPSRSLGPFDKWYSASRKLPEHVAIHVLNISTVPHKLTFAITISGTQNLENIS
jgi:hypothetical protein